MESLNYPLPALDGTDAPAFLTASAAKEWQGTLPLTNPAEVQNALLQEIEKLNRFPLPAAERFAILDSLRKAVNFAQDEAVKRYGNKALPLNFLEQKALNTTLQLRRACLTGTLHCLQGALSDTNPEFIARVLQRAMVHLVSLQLESLRGGQALPASHWQHLHSLLVIAEARSLSTVTVADSLRYGEGGTTILAAYSEALLLHAASPFEMSPRSLNWMARWAKRWGAKLVLSSTAPEKLDALPLAVDLHSSLPPRHQPFSGPGARFLLTQGLRESIKSRIALLGQGRLPAELQLGDDCTQPACEQLLKQLYPRWCKDGQVRGSERRPENAPGRVLIESDSIYYYLSDGHHLHETTATAQLSIADLRREREHMAMFGTVQRPSTPKVVEKALPPPLESDWQLKDESAIGVRMAHPLKTGAISRLKLGQLVALEPPGSRDFFLASIRWLMAAPEDGDGWLHAGAQLLPGPGEALTFRVSNTQEAWRPCYFLPALAARKEPESLVIPAGVFRGDRQLELRDGTAIKLTRLLERGDNYERVLYG